MNQPLLSPSATQGLRQEQRGQQYVPCAGVRSLMRGNEWPLLRAWREWHGHTRTSMAACLGIAPPTYALLDDGTIALCRWTTARLELALLDAERQSTQAPLPGKRRARSRAR